MNAILFLTGSLMIAALPLQAAADSPSGTDRQAALELLNKTLQAAQEQPPAEQLAQYRAASEPLRRLCPGNVAIARILENAQAKAEAARQDERQAAALWRTALREAQETLNFKPLLEAPLPEGFPQPTPVGEIHIKQYPAYRLAKTAMGRNESGAFWILFNHIKKKEIAMTAPVEMTYRGGGKDDLQAMEMAFLYRSTRQGALGQDGKAEVVEVPPMTVLSLGLRGDATPARVAQAQAHLEAWLKNHKAYEAAGPLRVMGYNSPFVMDSRRYSEVEIPVQRTDR